MGLLGSEKIGSTDFSNLKYCLAGGAACSEYLLKTWEAKTGCVMLEGGGMSEGAPVSGNPTHGERRFMSAGPVPPLTEIEIVDLENGENVMPVGERGEIRIKADTFTNSYTQPPAGDRRSDPRRLALHRRYRDIWTKTAIWSFPDARKKLLSLAVPMFIQKMLKPY